MEHILLIANASAGTHEQEALQAALSVLQELSDVRIESTKDAEDLDRVLRENDKSSVVVAGGDGSLHAVVNALAHQQRLDSTPLGLIPLGTGNDFARGVGIPLDPEEAARLIASGRTTPTDLIVDDTGLVVTNNAHLGVGAEASRAAQKWKPRLGRIGYALGALSAGYDPQFVRVTVTVDGREVVRRRRVAQVAIGNGSNVGGGTELIPGADPSDGELVVIVSRARGILRRFSYVARLRRGKHHLMKEVDRTTGSHVVVEGDPFYVITDGEISDEPTTRRTWDLKVGALEMYLPPKSDVAGDDAGATAADADD
ncbi:MAG: Transcription regulator [contains diacylglycerol kinase catalytic domain] [uncultured Nocardioidaceae bacterium]|uniref:Transcription regulator [contains diacylglycerol kinase catalytic domain] n=1 Tax=uncultured Nocardioidaceae bacterium TaxID=253824 RepID=A0A6J4MQF4_9ACTN|nr:MAG: Transcription regulator [contains diacylglycerol kinase catalytic domain] [uncultured Nocardioidaceae bacterium]